MGYLSCKSQSSISTAACIRKSTSSASTASTATTTAIRHFTHDELDAATSSFSDSSLLGRGSHGSVFLASFPSAPPLAVKRPSRPHPSETLNEISILSNILPPSPRLVNLVGLTPSPPPLLVLEYMPNGSLFDLLHSPPPSQPPPSWSLRLRLALQSAKALLFLHSHSPPVLHRDVKSANVLLDSRHNARLADFGLALFLPSSSQTTPPPAGTLGYLDPAYVTPEKLSPKTDVFSFGILLLEIISGRKAIDVSHSPPSILEWALPLVRRGKTATLFDPRIPPPRDPTARRHLAALAASCVRSSRDRRPSMDDVVRSLQLLRKSIPSSKVWNGLHVANPCSAVDTVRTSTPPPSSDEEEGSSFPPPALASSRSSRKVYSEAGSRNLLDLIKSSNEEILRYRGGGVSRYFCGKEVEKNRVVRNAFQRLPRMAMRILKLTSSSSGCERNWSSFEAVHTKKWNRLELKRMNDLVYVKFNSKLRERQRGTKKKDPLATKDRTHASDWFVHGQDEEVFEGAGLTWDMVSEASGAEEASQSRRSQRLAPTVATLEAVEEEFPSEDETDDDDLDALDLDEDSE